VSEALCFRVVRPSLSHWVHASVCASGRASCQHDILRSRWNFTKLHGWWCIHHQPCQSSEAIHKMFRFCRSTGQSQGHSKVIWLSYCSGWKHARGRVSVEASSSFTCNHGLTLNNRNPVPADAEYDIHCIIKQTCLVVADANFHSASDLVSLYKIYILCPMMFYAIIWRSHYRKYSVHRFAFAITCASYDTIKIAQAIGYTLWRIAMQLSLSYKTSQKINEKRIKDQWAREIWKCPTVSEYNPMTTSRRGLKDSYRPIAFVSQ